MLIMSVMASGFNYLYQIISGRILTTDEFGTINASFSVINILTVAGVALGMSIAKHISEDNCAIGGIVKKLFFLSFLLIPIVIPIIVAVMLFMDFSLAVGILTAFSTFLISIAYIFHGTLQGCQKFMAVSGFNMFLPFSKFAVGTLLLLLNFGINSVYFAMIIGSIAEMAYAYFILRKQLDFSKSASKEEIMPIIKYLFFTAVCTAAITTIDNIDILLVKRFFTSETVGMYSCSALFGKIVLYIPAVLTTMMFPIVAKKDENGKKALKKTLIYSLFVSAAASIVLFLLKDYIIQIIMGSKYKEAEDYIFSTIMFVLPLVAITVMVNYLVARGDKWFVTICCFFGVIGIVFVSFAVHSTVQTMLFAIAAVCWIQFIILFVRSIIKDGK